MNTNDEPIRNPHANPLIIGILMILFGILFCGVLFGISPSYRYAREQTVMASVSEVKWVEYTSGRHRRKLAIEEQYWRVTYCFQQANGTARKGYMDLQPGAEKPEYQEFAVRYTEGRFAESRPASSVTVWSECRYFFLGSAFITVFLLAAFAAHYRMWRSAEDAVEACQNGSIDREEALTTIASAAF